MHSHLFGVDYDPPPGALAIAYTVGRTPAVLGSLFFPFQYPQLFTYRFRTESYVAHRRRCPAGVTFSANEVEIGANSPVGCSVDVAPGVGALLRGTAMAASVGGARSAQGSVLLLEISVLAGPIVVPPSCRLRSVDEYEALYQPGKEALVLILPLPELAAVRSSGRLERL